MIDISVLYEKKELTHKAMLLIEPLAPLSLVSSMPGAYYRSQREPSNFMLYGMLENLLGWHFTDNERSPIINKLKKHHKKQYKDESLVFEKTPVGYRPLLQYHLKIEDSPRLLPQIEESYEDYWTQHLKDVDQRHAKGTRNYDYKLSSDIDAIYNLDPSQRDKAWETLYKQKSNLFPTYYQSPTKREFIKVKGNYGFNIVATENLLKILINAINELENPPYLGTNEGWVNLKINEL